MTQQQYIINRKLNVLELGQTLGNISEAGSVHNFSLLFLEAASVMVIPRELRGNHYG